MGLSHSPFHSSNGNAGTSTTIGGTTQYCTSLAAVVPGVPNKGLREARRGEASVRGAAAPGDAATALRSARLRGMRSAAALFVSKVALGASFQECAFFRRLPFFQLLIALMA
jgi:hypothetical protein